MSCYRGFGDDDAGFYAVYREVFENIATEDIEFMDSPDEYEDIPKFGTSTSSYDDVVGPFYAYWQSYCTRKTYAWLCPHNVSEYRDRRILREIEKETKKIAQKARKERNDEVRALVGFVRKRDKRLLEYKRLLEEKAEQNRVKQQMHRLEQLKRNKEEAEAMRKNTKSAFDMGDHEQRLRQMEQAYGSEDSDAFDESEEDEDEEDGEEGNESDDCDSNGEANGDDDDAELLYVDDLYCVACNKAFKNDSSYVNHESSKKHRENIDRLKKKLQAEEKLYENGQKNGDVDNGDDVDLDDIELDASDHSDIESEPVPLPKQKLSKKAKKAKNRKQQIHQADDNCDDDGDVKQSVDDQLSDIEQPLADVHLAKVSDDDDDDVWADDNKKGRRGKNKKGQQKKNDGVKATTAAPPPSAVDIQSDDDVPKPSAKTKIAKKNIRVAPVELDPDMDIAHTCVTCKSEFDSKNKLFAHLKKTKHGVYLPKASTSAPATEPKKGKRKWLIEANDWLYSEIS